MVWGSTIDFIGLCLLLGSDCVSHCFRASQEPLMTRIVNFSVVQAMNVAIVYTVDAYRPIGGEVVVTQLVFKGTKTAFVVKFALCTDLS
jgi:hypothetical protein